MDMDGLDNCDICMEIYDDNVRPRSLTCGHSFCTRCLDNFIKNGGLLCPHCKQSHSASSAHDFPINYGMEQMISNFRKAQIAMAASHQSGAISKEGKSTESLSHQSISDKMLSVILEQKHSTQNLVHESKKMQSHLHQYKNFLFERKAKHEDLYLQVMMNLANRNKESFEKINTEYEKVTAFQKEGKTLENKAIVSSESLADVTSAKSALAVIDKHDKHCVALEVWYKNCQNQMPNSCTINFSEKVVRDTTAALSMVTREEEEDAKETLDLSQSSLSIMDKLCRIRGQTTLTLKGLRSMSESVNNMLEKGHLYAVQYQDGQIRSAKVTRKDNKTNLHYLQDGEPPVHAHTIQQSDLIGTLNNGSVVVFMDLAWNGSTRGRIHILLSPATPLGQHFRILCSGDLGPSYAHSKFLKVVDKGNANERVKGGDYEHNDGSGGAPLTRGLNMHEKIYERKFVAGIIWARYNMTDGPKSAQFVIGTGKGNNADVQNVFGQVQEGLDVVREAARQEDIGDVTITDCGIVLPL